MSKPYSFVNDDGICMICQRKPPSDDTLSCNTCDTHWHLPCLPNPKTTSSDALRWDCPDCSPVNDPALRAIESHSSVTVQEKNSDVLDIVDGVLNCSLCVRLLERPVTTPCGHHCCFECFKKWIEEGKSNCAKCGNEIPSKMASQPRINSQLAIAIRLSKVSKSVSVYDDHHFIHNQKQAKKRGGKFGGGKIMVTVGQDHFGPILAVNDPVRNQGILVGETWENRMGCRQWGVHLPLVAGVAGHSRYGAQSVVLLGGYEDYEDHGEWFLYTGSGGRDLGGNKYCTSKDHPYDQKFENLNEALRVSCQEGYPVRVVRSHKKKRSCYTPETGLRYDGIYRIEKCWRKNGIQGHKVCRYLFVRCDNEPAPWTSEDYGDRPRPLPVIGELKNAVDLTERKGAPSWDYDEGKGCWLWKRSPPHLRKQRDSITVNAEDGTKVTRVRREIQIQLLREKLLQDFSCYICGKVLSLPLTTPCAHNFCKACLLGAFSALIFFRNSTAEGGRYLPPQNNIMKCPSFSDDIAHHFLRNPQVNRELMGEIESLQRQVEVLMEENDEEEMNVNNDLEEQSYKRRRGGSVICVLNRQQTIDEYLEQEDDDDIDN